MAIQKGEDGLSLWDAARAMGIPVTQEVEPHDRDVRVNGIRLHYLDWGNEGKPPVVLLHGGLQTAHSWDFVALALRDRYHVRALDQRGHGDSDWASDQDYSLEAQVKDLEVFIDTLAMERVVLMGLSMGGRNSFVYASRHPERMKALVIVDMAPKTREQGQREIERFTDGFPEELDSFEEFVQRVHAYNPRRSVEQLRGSLQHNVRQFPNGKWSWKYDKGIRSSERRSPRWDEAQLWDAMRRISCPTLVVWGAESNMMDREIAEQVAEAIPQAQLAAVPKAGHLVTGDNPMGFVEAVGRFLTTLGE